MKDQELHDIFHAYRPEIDDNDAFMDQLSTQMDAIDAQQRPRILPLYRKVLPWAMGIAAAIAVAALVISPSLLDSPTVLPAKEGAISFEDGRELPANHSVPSLAGRTRREFGSSLSFTDSYDEIVNEIETSGQQLEKAIAQL